MRPITTSVRLIILIFCLFVSLVQAQNGLTNADVVHMVTGGIRPAVLKATINKSKTAFDLSPEGLIQLKKSGLSDDIVMAMISKTNTVTTAPAREEVQHFSSGIYVKSVDKYLALEPGYLTSAASKGFGGSLQKYFSKLVVFKTKAMIAHAHSEFRIAESRPAWLFVFEGPAHGPEDFFLVRLRTTDSTRQIIYEKPVKGAGQIVISDSLKIDFNVKKKEGGFYEVSPILSLSPGEYGFIYNSAALYSGNRYRIFDFSIGEKETVNKQVEK